MNTFTIHATPEAKAHLENYWDEVIRRRKAGELGDVSQYVSRWSEQSARIAVTLHACLHGANAHQHPLTLETAENAVRVAKWFAEQQLSLLSKGRRAAAAKVEEEVMQLLEHRTHGRRLETGERETGHPTDFVTARIINRARITTTGEASLSLLLRLERDGILIGLDVRPAHGGTVTRQFRTTTGKNPVPE